MINPDIDIDTKTSFNPKLLFPAGVKASILQDHELKPHPCGFYFQAVAEDPITKLSAIPYKAADELGFLKIDFLHLSIYNHFESRAEIDALIKVDPDWSLLEDEASVKKLFQLSKHYDILMKIKPKTVLGLADVLALIRPSKRYLVKNYLAEPDRYRPFLYTKEADEAYGFKKAHAISYALVVVLNLHLISCGVI